ncbi:MAG: hypothetical protein LUD01_08650 [Clostridiales bacterium]|nr:hypothetical protein [Clostridiales bacterium]
MARNIIRSIRKGSVQWNEDDRQTIATLLVKAGYAVRITRRMVPGQSAKKANPQMEYIVEYWEEDENQ